MLHTGITILVPSFHTMVNLTGGFVNSLMGFILPPIFYLRLTHQRGGRTLASTLFHLSITVFGCITLVLTTYYTVHDLKHNNTGD